MGALVCMGGSNAAAAFSVLAPIVPIGIPKILMATSVAGETRALVQGGDVTMLYPVLDIEGGQPDPAEHDQPAGPRVGGAAAGGRGPPGERTRRTRSP